jgi:signal transduction histidine kinase
MQQENHVKQLETKVIRLKEELRRKELEAENLKGAFLANISHEIRTPMNAIVGFSSLLRDNDISLEDQKDFLNEIISSAHHLTGLLDDIIEVATLQFATKKDIKREEFDPSDLLQDLIDEYQYKRDSLYKEGLEIILDIKSSPKKTFSSNKRILYKILSNLIDNSLKFTSEGNIKIGMICLDEFVQFYVIDTGIGIPKEKLNLIFTNFSKVWKNEGKVLYDGLGIGLSTAKNLVEIINGDINVESTEGKGTSVFLNLPYSITSNSVL